MSAPEEIWLPLVDEPIGGIVKRIQRENADIDRLVGTPHRILAFRTFAYLRVGILLGGLLVDSDVAAGEGAASWVDQLLESPANRQRVVDEVRAVAGEIAADPRYGEDEGIGPDEAARERFRDIARRSLGS